jgi:NAD(P)-dependent dehydrogenase (short-subunit alcohol dehydrogenase family)
MLEQGARQFLFMSRNGASSAAVVDHIKGLEARGAQVTILKGDVSRYEDVEGTVNSIQIPLGGVIHAAMNLDVRITSSS